MVLIWLADSAAYFVGRRHGRRRLASRISPGKTWEGLLGAMVAVAVASVAWQAAVGLKGKIFIDFIVLCIVTGLASVVGDLCESQTKRWAGVKDSGALLPGHGGILDRIDSLTAAAPVFVGGLVLLGIK
jgi:phosphatidate cytidylyltransferase